MRLLPSRKGLGWTPYAWLVYLFFLFIVPAYSHGGWRSWLATAAAVVIFLPLYFLGYWLKGWRLVAIMSAITLLGIITWPWNSGGAVFFIYAAAFAGFAGEPAFAVRLLVAIVAVLGVQSWLLHLPMESWIIPLVFSVLIGSVNIHFAQRWRADERLRLANEEIEHLAKVAERERIARDLHDVLGHTLSVIVLKSELASKLIERDPARAVSEIREVEKISRDALGEVRSAIRGYRADSLTAEFTRARATLETAGVTVECAAEPLPLTPVQETVLALVVREAVTNVVRHAGAHHCRLELAQLNGNCRLRIRDDGRGGFLATEGAGLRGMRERVQALQGTLQRASEGGTTLTITLPLADISSEGCPR